MLTFVTTSKGRLNHLKLTLPRLTARDDIDVVVVDYNCPQRSGDWVERNCPSARVIRVGGEELFNPSRARNAGAAAVRTPWICFIDADIVVTSAFVPHLLSCLREGTYLRFKPEVSDIVGTVVCHQSDFDRVGGYDEAFQGWGVEDDDLYTSLEMSGVQRVELDPNLVSFLSHDDHDRMQYRAYQDRWLGWMVNRIYRAVKLDLMRLSGSIQIPLEARQGLFAHVQSAVAEANLDEAFNLEIGVDQSVFRYWRSVWNPGDVPGNWLFNRRLVYSLKSITEEVADSFGQQAQAQPREPAAAKKRLLLNWVYYPAIGHVVEALQVAESIRQANPNFEIGVAVNAQSASLLRECVPQIDLIYGVDPRHFLDGSPIENPLGHIPADWDYVINDPRQDSPQAWQGLARFQQAFADHVSAKPDNADALIWRLEPISLAIPAPAQRFANHFLGEGNPGSRISLILGADSEAGRTPPLEFWRELISALTTEFDNLEIVVLGAFDPRRTQTRGISRQDVEQLATCHENVIDACDIGLINQLALSQRCDLHISPHTGVSFAIQAVGVPWISLSGAECAEYFVNGVPFASVYPTCERYPCGRFVAPEKNSMLEECQELQETGDTFPCLSTESLTQQIPHILGLAHQLMSGELTYHDSLECHWNEIKARIGRSDPSTFFHGGGRVFEDDFVFRARNQR